MLKAAALFYAIIVSFIIAVLLGCLILLSYYSHLQINNTLLLEKLRLNAQSGINLLLSSQYIVKQGSSQTIDLHGDGDDKVLLGFSTWGGFGLITAKAFLENKSSDLMALTGFQSQDLPALYLADQGKPLSLSGKCIIKGNCVLPKAGVKRAYIEGRYFEGQELIQGKVTSSDPAVPQLNKEMQNQLLSFFSNKFPSLSDSLVNYESKREDSVFNSFHGKTLCLYSNKTILITGNSIFSGNIIIYSSQQIKVNRGSVLQDVILVSPFIEFEKGFSGSLQAFASDTLQVNENVSFKYPSMLGIVKKANSLGNSKLIIGAGTSVSGVLLAFQEQGKTVTNMKLTIARECKVTGVIYTNGLLELGGEVHGSVYCNSLTLTTASAMYEDHLLDVTIDASQLPEYYVCSGLMELAKQQRVVKWMY